MGHRKRTGFAALTFATKGHTAMFRVSMGCDRPVGTSFWRGTASRHLISAVVNSSIPLRRVGDSAAKIGCEAAWITLPPLTEQS